MANLDDQIHRLDAVATPRDRLDRLVALLMRTFRFWWVAAVVLGMGGAASLAFATSRPRLYTSEAVLLYREGIKATVILGQQTEGEATRKLGLRLKEMITARPRVKEVIDELGLYKKEIERQGYTQVIDGMRGRMGFRVREGDTFLLSFTHADPDVAQKVVEKLSASLIFENTRYRSQLATNTQEFIAAEKKRAEEELRTREKALASWTQRHPEFAADAAGTGAAVRAAEKQKAARPSVDSEMLALEREAARLRQRLSLPSAPSGPLPKPQRDPALVAARDQAERDLRAAQRDLADKQARLTDQHPDVMAAKREVTTADARLKLAQDAVLAGEVIPEVSAPPATAAEKPDLEQRLRRVESEIAAVRRRKAGGEAPVAGGTGSDVAAEIVETETEWARLNREVGEARQRYEQLDDRDFMATMAASSEETGQAAQIEVLDPAFRPTKPTGAGRFKWFLMGIMATMGMAAALVLALAVFDDRLYDKTDVESLGLGPVLVTVPRAGVPGRSRGLRATLTGRTLRG